MTAEPVIPWYRRMAWRTAAGVAVALAVVVMAVRQQKQPGEDGESPMFEVQRGPLAIGISLSGTIRSLKQEVIVNRVEGQTTLIYLIDEGALVSEGELLAQLDDSALKDRLVEQEIRVQNAEAAFIRARETLAVTRNQAESDIALAELNYGFAQEDLKQYEEGQYRQQILEADATITLAEEELQLAARKLEWSEKLFKENYLSQSDRDADQLAHQRAKLNLELAGAAKNLLENFTYKRELAQLESDVDQTRRALERAKLKASADIVQAEADLKARESEWRQQQTKEEKVKDQIAKTRIVAPRAGQVVYATSVRVRWRGGGEPLEAGQTVRERQELIYLPTADRMMAEVQVHESNLDKMRIGLAVVVTVDALQGRRFEGKVTRIAPLPDATSMWMNPDLKVYRTEIELEGRHPELKTGMSCLADILVERYADAVYIPVQAVLRVAGQPTAYVRKGNAFAPVGIEVGLDNNRMIHVLSGLEAGQIVLLTPPLQAGEESMDGRPEDVIPGTKGESVASRTSVAPPKGEAESGGEEEKKERVEGGPERTQEQREAMRKRLESMTSEQRQEAMKRFGRGEAGQGPARGGRP